MFDFSLGNSFYCDLAYLQVFRTIWTQALAEEFDIETPPPTQVSAHTDVATLTQEPEQNRLRLALQGLAAVHGGADLLFLAPIERIDQSPSPTGRATARQIQLTLRGADREAIQLDKTYLAELSDKLTTAARRRLQHIKAQGGFAQATEF
ncbi:MAG: methylmalonyl-CoA mutase family protein [Bacteroidota bacterium]